MAKYNKTQTAQFGKQEARESTEVNLLVSRAETGEALDYSTVLATTRGLASAALALTDRTRLYTESAFTEAFADDAQSRVFAAQKRRTSRVRAFTEVCDRSMSFARAVETLYTFALEAAPRRTEVNAYSDGVRFVLRRAGGEVTVEGQVRFDGWGSQNNTHVDPDDSTRVLFVTGAPTVDVSCSSFRGTPAEGALLADALAEGSRFATELQLYVSRWVVSRSSGFDFEREAAEREQARRVERDAWQREQEVIAASHRL